MDHWKDKDAVVRDLERVSRGRLKVDIDPCLTAGKPVSCFGEEETEEEFYRRHCSGDANFDEPDLESIRKLLFMVQGDQETYKIIQSNGPIQVSKLNIEAPEFKPTDKSKTDQETYPKDIKDIPISVDGKKKPARARRGNVAITSILARQLELIKKESLETKLFKPEDFSLHIPNKEKLDKTETFEQARVDVRRKSPKKESIPKTTKAPPNTTNFNTLESQAHISKLNNKIEIEESNVEALKHQNGFTYPMFSSPSSMFKRKTPKTSPPEAVEKVPEKTPDIPKRGAYVPSPHAEEYYKKFVQNSEMRKAVTEDLWTRTMAQMKILDEKQKEEEELKIKEKLEKREKEKRNNSESVSNDAESDENLFQYLPGCDFDDSATPKSSKASTYTCASSLDISGFPESIQLPQHRHLLTGECVVCQAEERAAHRKLYSQTTSETSVNFIEFSESSSQSSPSVDLVLEV